MIIKCQNSCNIHFFYAKIQLKVHSTDINGEFQRIVTAVKKLVIFIKTIIFCIFYASMTKYHRADCNL